MAQQVYTFSLQLEWQILNAISKIDRFDATWSSIEKRESRNVKQLKSIATVRSVGASTRIEGSQMTDDEVEILIQNLDISKLEDRDAQEVAGYFTTLDLISDSYGHMEIKENNIKTLHKTMMQFSQNDHWHRGDYKQSSNSVQATTPEGKKYIIFETTAPGMATEAAMKKLVEWYEKEKEIHPLVNAALFCYDFVSIHPFQDGNGRMSRLLASLILLKKGYKWIQYISFEHEIENRKGEYYRKLMECQKQRPNEDVTPWVLFFLDCLNNMKDNLMKKLEAQSVMTELDARQKNILIFIEHHSSTRTGEISKKLNIPLPTVKKAVAGLLQKGLIEKSGSGPGTTYIIL